MNELGHRPFDWELGIFHHALSKYVIVSHNFINSSFCEVTLYYSIHIVGSQKTARKIASNILATIERMPVNSQPPLATLGAREGIKIIVKINQLQRNGLSHERICQN